jgi:hypothetical protein
MRLAFIFLFISFFSFGQIRKDVTMASSISSNYNGAGSNYIVHANNGSVYVVYINTASDIVYKKSNDGGLNWTVNIVVFAGSATQVSVWYDRWSGLATDLIHIAYTESATDDTLYRTINTASSDALSTQTVIFGGASTATGNFLSITRAVGGNVYCRTQIDAGVEGGFYRLPNANVPSGAWDAARTINEANATLDQIHLAPDLTAADNQDIIAIFWDASENEISRQLYDDSGDSWSETSIATSMTELATTSAYTNLNIAMDLTNSQIIMAAWSAIDAANADLRCWTITNSAITEVTNVVLNSTDDQALCAVTVDTATNDWYVFYVGASNGSETWSTSVNVYYKRSTDSGTTWSSETKLTSYSPNRQILNLRSIPRTTGNKTLNVMMLTGGDLFEQIMSMPMPFEYGYAH